MAVRRGPLELARLPPGCSPHSREALVPLKRVVSSVASSTASPDQVCHIRTFLHQFPLTWSRVVATFLRCCSTRIKSVAPRLPTWGPRFILCMHAWRQRCRRMAAVTRSCGLRHTRGHGGAVAARAMGPAGAAPAVTGRYGTAVARTTRRRSGRATRAQHAWRRLTRGPAVRARSADQARQTRATVSCSLRSRRHDP